MTVYVCVCACACTRVFDWQWDAFLTEYKIIRNSYIDILNLVIKKILIILINMNYT